MKNYIKESQQKILREWKEWFLFKTIPIKIVNPFLNKNIQINKIIFNVEKILKSPKYIKDLKAIYFGDFQFLKAKKVQSLFLEGNIYISSLGTQSEDVIAKDIIHEIGHLLEYSFKEAIYSDNFIIQEFIGKRKRLYDLLKHDFNSLSREYFLNNIEYNLEIDNFLYNIVGYERLQNFIQGLFLSPYCATDVHEYFANGFEEYKTGDYSYLKNISPMLFKKITELENSIGE